MTADGCVESEMEGAATPTIKKDDRKWTVMVFMGADTIAGNAPLHGAAKRTSRRWRSSDPGDP